MALRGTDPEPYITEYALVYEEPNGDFTDPCRVGAGSAELPDAPRAPTQPSPGADVVCHTYICIYMDVCTCIYVYICIYMYIYVYICVFAICI